MSIRYTAEQLRRKFAGPAGSPGYPRVADALRLEGRGEEAIDLCREGLRARPAVAGYVVLGKALMDAGRLEEAREEFEAALRLDARCLSAMHALAQIMDRLQWRDAAAGYYRSILDVEPWDDEMRALVEGAPPPYADQAPAPVAAPPSGEDTFVKPEGLEGEVLEVNLNDMADAFLPSGGDLQLDPALDEPIAPPASEAFPPTASADPVPGGAVSSASPEGDASGGEEPPISGNDVEERLDSIFGSEGDDGPSPASTWTAAPALDDAGSEASSTATGLLRTSGPFESPVPESGPSEESAPTAEPVGEGPVPDPDSGRFEIAEAGEPVLEGFATDPVAERVEDPAPAPFAGADDAQATRDAAETVHGEDIERRLDELFNLSGDDDKPPAAPVMSASELPVAPSPVGGETVLLGEVVGFGDAQSIPAGRETAEASAGGEIVTGQDVADKLDSLFGPDPQAKAPAQAGPESADAAAAGTLHADEAEIPPGGTLLSTETLLPSAWTGDAPQVTGADVEAQLDRLFDLEPSAPAAPSEAGNGGDTVSSMIPPAEARGAEAGGSDLPRDGSSTVPGSVPARGMEPFQPSGDTDFSGEGLGDTMIIPQPGMETIEPSAFAPGDGPGEAFDTLAPEEIPGISETAAIEMVDGGDVAERLDKLFEPEAEPAPEPEIVSEPIDLPEAELADPESDLLAAGATMEVPVAVADAAGPLAGGGPGLDAGRSAIEAPDGEDGGAASEAGRDEAGKGTFEGGAGDIPAASMQMMDEEEGYPEEEDASGSAAGANVATVTLAEIYFQQGLKEQALQIYRQLLEREPDNESVRKRIAEIEATRADAGSGDAPDPRWPRPGLKVPKRKK